MAMNFGGWGGVVVTVAQGIWLLKAYLDQNWLSCVCKKMLLTMIIVCRYHLRLDTINQARKRSTSVIWTISLIWYASISPGGQKCPDDRGCTVWHLKCVRIALIYTALLH